MRSRSRGYATSRFVSYNLYLFGADFGPLNRVTCCGKKFEPEFNAHSQGFADVSLDGGVIFLFVTSGWVLFYDNIDSIRTRGSGGMGGGTVGGILGRVGGVDRAQPAECQEANVTSDDIIKDLKPRFHSSRFHGSDDAEDDDDDIVNIWNLRKCSDAALDIISNRQNVRIVYDAIGTLVDVVGGEFNQPKYIEILMTPLIAKWQQLSNSNKDLFLLLECFTSIIQLLTKVDPVSAEVQFDKEFVVCSLDLLSRLTEVLGSGIKSLVSQSNLRDLLMQCCMDDGDDIRQSAFSLLGDLARRGLVLILQHAEGLNKSLIKNSAITLDRLASVYPELVSPHMENFMQSWCIAFTYTLDMLIRERYPKFIYDIFLLPYMLSRRKVFSQSESITIDDDDDLDDLNANKNIGSQNSTEAELNSANEEPSSQLFVVSDSTNGSILTSPLVNSTYPLRFALLLLLNS
ncbi:transportin-1-like protein isoform X3 [Tanacetum coccineum]